MEISHIPLPVKFYAGLFISVLRNKQLFTKNWGFKPDQFSKSLNFETFRIPPFGKRTDHPLGKAPTFLGPQFFFCEQDRQPIIKFNIHSEVLLSIE
jgi:hypothetical protein